MHLSKLRYRKLLSLVTIALIIFNVLIIASKVKPVFSQTPLLVDPHFDNSTNSTDLRDNALGQDWYESRGGFSGGNSSLLTLDTSNVGGNSGKKAGLKNYGISQNAYLTQEFNSSQTGNFTVSFDIYVDRIEDNANYDRAGHVYIGDDHISTNAPTGTSDERFVFMAFYDSTPGDTGTDLEIRARTSSGQAWGTTSAWTQVTTGLSYNTWYRIKIDLNITNGTYDVYVDGVLKGNDIAKYSGYPSASVVLMTLAADSDGRGDFYVDNVFSPARDHPIVSVNPSSKTVIVGEQFSIDIDLDYASNLYGYEIWLSFDNSKLNATAISYMNFLNSPTNIWSQLVNNTGGYVTLAVSSLFPASPKTGGSPPPLARVNLKCIGTGNSSLHLYKTILSDNNAMPVTHDTIDGQVVCTPSTIYDDIVFDSDFDMGNLINVQFQDGDASGYRYYTAEVNYSTATFPDKHWWFYFSMSNTTYNNENWLRVPDGNYSCGNNVTRNFNVTLSVTQDKIWLAPIPPYTVTMRDNLLTSFASSPYLNVTSLGITPLGQNLTVATITDPIYPGDDKFKIYIIAQQHAGETPSSFLTEGMIRFLLNETDETAAKIRRSYIFRIVPIVNVEGVYYGISRYTPFRAEW